MGCCGDREKQEYLREEQRWEYINLSDFKASSCWTGFAYGWLWAMLFVSISVYAADTFTCINLLVYDQWAGQIKPFISFDVARYIFSGCILLSFILLVYRWVRAVRVMRQGGVAKSYLDPLAVRVQSIRMGQRGRGWRRFLLFAELTKSRKGADYVALFAYYSFEAWLRIVFAEGPRQVINGITLFYVMRAKLVPEGEHAAPEGISPVAQFFVNIKVMADENMLQAIVLLGMVWTLLIWVISALSLAMSVILYLIFLWHHIPSQDGTLTNYCRNKINRRMARIVKVKVDKALKKENELRTREEARAERDGTGIKKQPTLPNITGLDDKMPPLSRQTTMTTLPEYESRPGSLRDSRETLPPLPTNFNGNNRPQPSRHGTSASDASWASYNSNAPLMSQAGEMGQVPFDRTQTPGSIRPGPSRNLTGFSQYSDQPFTPITRPGTSNSTSNGPGSYQMEPIPRTGTATSNMSRGRRQPSDLEQFSPVPRDPTVTANHSPADDAGGSYFPPVAVSGRSPAEFGPPMRSQTFQDPPPRAFTPQGVPDRNMTASVPVQRSMTAQGPPTQRSFTSTGPPPRAFTPYTPTRDQSQTPVGNGSTRSFTPVGPPSRTFTPYKPGNGSPTAPPPDRSVNASANSAERSYTPAGQAPERSFTPAGPAPSLARVQTSSSVASSGYTAFNPRSATPASVSNPVVSESSSNTIHTRPYRSFSRPLGADQRDSGDVNRDSGVDDILSHY